MYDLIRTVDHVYDDGSESIIEVRAMVTPGDKERDEPGVAIVKMESAEGSSVHVSSFEQADRLHRALYAALEAAGHERP